MVPFGSVWCGIVAWEEANSRVIPLGRGTLSPLAPAQCPVLYDIGQSFDQYPTELGNGLCPIGATPVWAPWWVEGAWDEFLSTNDGFCNHTNFDDKAQKQRTRQKWKCHLLRQVVCHPGSGRWQTTIKNLTVRYRQGSKVRSRNCQINQMPSQWRSTRGSWLLKVVHSTR